MYTPDRSSDQSSAASSGGDANRNARYAYLVARLRNRQMTMEEATELFSIMNGMLQTSEAARAALLRTPPPPVSRPTKAEPRPAAAPGSSDEFLLLGILAMGAGAGLLAAMTKRLQDATPPSGQGSGSTSGSAVPKG